MQSLKQQIVSAVVDQVADQYRVPADKAMKTWWVNIREQGGLRLSRLGFEVFCSLDFEQHTIKHGMFSKKTLLDLDRKLQWPYYIDLKSQCIIMFSGKEATVVLLYGDLQKFLDSLTN